MTSDLHPDHRRDLEKSGLSPETIKGAGVYSVPPDQIKKIMGWDAPVNSLLAFPYHGTDFIRYKLFPPLTDKNGKDQKYYQQRGSGIRLYRPVGFDDKAAVIRFTEGEKKALKGTQEELNVCALGGVWNFGTKDDNGQAWLIEDFDQIELNGRIVEIVPDADFRIKESGAHAVYRFGTLLESKGATVKVVCLPGVMKLDGYLVKYSTEDFLKLPRITIDDPFFRPSIVREKGLAYAIGQSVLSIQSLLKKKIEPRPVYLWPWLRAGTLAMIYSTRGYGKTFLSLVISLALTRKLSIGNWRTDKIVGVLYVDGEMPLEDVKDRADLLIKGLSPELAPFHILSAAAMQADGWPTPNLTNVRWREALSQYLTECGIYHVLILDNIASLTPGVPEGKKEDWDEVNQWLLSLRFMGLAVILIHHAGKSGDQRGTSGREDALDVTIKLTRPAGYRPEDGCVFDVEFSKARGVYGSGAASFNFRIVQNGEGGLSWTTDAVGSDSKGKIVALIGNGIAQKDISALLGCSKAWVSRCKSKAVKDGYLSKSGELTPEGKIYCEEIDVDELLV